MNPQDSRVILTPDGSGMTLKAILTEKPGDEYRPTHP